jgi:hypothetical protein
MVIVKIKMIPPQLLVKAGVSLAAVVVPNVLVARAKVIVGKVWSVCRLRMVAGVFVRCLRL